ncbi:MAG: protein NO VEIN domain-containing protein, partial [Candidatus Glassbacteria bacterium]
MIENAPPIHPGTIIQGPFWPEPVEVKLIEEAEEYVHIVGATIRSGGHIDQLIPKGEFLKLSVTDRKATFREEPWKVFLALETIRYRFASLYDPLLAMNTSKVDPLPHQIEAVYGYVLKLPRIRFLIADDPGAGKTIMAGLVIKEMKIRNQARRILAVVPGHLRDQWKRELKDRFEEKFFVASRETMNSLYGENIWMRENQVITSLDFAKQDDILPSIAAAQFDLIIVDEAHKMSAYRPLIFTESRDTLDYLVRKIRSWGYATNTIHGDMRLEERVKAEKVFNYETQVMVATEAAGEGINLQFCHLMINYDIPWNPNRLEQRMGRIHRYGQTKEVYVFNLVAEDTREGKVLHKLFQKLDEIRGALGSDKVFDVLSEVLYDKNLSQLLMEAAAYARNIDEILAEIDIEVDEDYVTRVKENLGESLATHYIDYTRIKEMAQQAREHRLIPEYTESYFKKALLKAGGRFSERKRGFLAVESVPYEIRKIAEDDLFKKTYGDLIRRYPRVTFDKEIAFKNPDVEFISFGHPLFEAVMRWVDQNYGPVLPSGASFSDPDGRLDGHILFYEGEIRDGTGKVAGKRLFGFYVDGKEVRPISPAVIWDFAEGDKGSDGTAEIGQLKERVAPSVITKLETYKAELLKERTRQAEIKEKYGIKSLEHLILKLDGDLIELYGRREQGENVDLVIRNKEERKREYERALDALKVQIGKEQSLTMSMPRFIGAIRVAPPLKADSDMISDEEVERIGMEVAMKHERTQGRTPEDVSYENLGFDIRSKAPDGEVRYIEVKGRAGRGAVALTQNEWFKARRFRDDYYLYVVMNTKKEPRLYIIQNPAEHLEPDERIEVVRYVVS